MATGEWSISGNATADPTGVAPPRAPEPLSLEVLARISDLRRRASRLVLIRGLALVAGVLAFATLVAGATDYWVRYRDVSLRWMSSLLVLAVVGVAAWRWLIVAWRGRVTRRQLIRQIEDRFPNLRNRLASVMDFAVAPDDPRFGSFQLRQHAVRQVAAELERTPLGEMLDWLPALRAVGGLVLVSGVLGGLIWLNFDSTLLAAKRLCLPWRSDEWPRRHHLTFVNAPARLAQGQDFRAEVVDHHGSLPSAVEVEYRWLEEPSSDIRRYAMVFAGGRMTHRLTGVRRSFEYRAVGGDDLDMPWRTMEVVAPPRILAARITLTPPAYSGIPSTQSARRIRALAGTAVTCEIETNQPLRAATLVFQTESGTKRIRTRVADGSRRASLPADPATPWVLATSGTYAWELVDDRGVTVVVDRDTEIEVVPDLPPALTLESPAVDAAFTPRAIVPLRVLVKDDLATKQLELRWPGGKKMLYEQATPPARPSDGMPAAAAGTIPVDVRVEHAWDLAERTDLKPGMKLSFELLARDFLPQDAAPLSGAIQLLTDAEFEQRMRERQEALLKLLREALQLQRTVHAGTSAVATQLQKQQPFSESESAAWPNLSLNERRVEGLLAGDDGAVRLVEQLLADLAANRWEAPQWVSHGESLRSELGRIVANLLPKILSELATAERVMRFARPELAKAEVAWTTASTGQRQVIEALEALIGQLGEWDRYRNLAQEVQQALDQHRAIREEVQSLGTAGMELDELPPEERMKLQDLSRRLQELANQVDRFQSRLEQLSEELRESNPEAAKTVRQALDVLEKDPISGGVRESARDVGENRLGAAARRFESTQQGLEALLAAVSESEDAKGEAFARQLPAVVANWIARQDQLMKETAAARDSGAPAESPERRQAVANLSEAQRALEAEVRERHASAPADSTLPLVLELIGAPMAQAVERLGRSQLDAETERLQRDALALLRELATTLEPKPQSPRSQPDEPETDQPDSPPTSRTPSLAELKLIRLAQLELLRRTGALQDRRAGDGTLPPADDNELRDLQQQQQRLAEWLETFLVPAPPEPAAVPSPPMQPMSRGTRGRDAFRWVAWIEPPPGRDAAPKKSGLLDQQLLDDLPPAPRSPEKAAGEDLGGASEEHPLAQLQRQCREANQRLRRGDTALGTQQLQRAVAAKLATMIQEAEDQQSPNNQSPQSSQPTPSETPKPGEAKQSGQQPGAGHGASNLDPDKLSNWARGAWGVLPDRVRTQIQDLGDEQFLPEYEQLIRAYFNRLTQ